VAGQNIAIVGGTGMDRLPEEIFAEPVMVTTRHGTVEVQSVSHNYVEPHKLYFLPRHGRDHRIPPHEINYRANTSALVELECGFALATNAVGSLRSDLPPRSLVVLDDFIDLTRGRGLTYYEAHAWKHTDFTAPYSHALRTAILEAGSQLGISLIARGTYVCCDGPRFESPAEVRLYRQFGGDVVGMTGLPEAIFAREAGIEYAAVAIVTNPGAGLSERPVEHTEVVEVMRQVTPNVRELLLRAAGITMEHRASGNSD
jgi:5'-methylthioadenosine phosphorylase